MPLNNHLLEIIKKYFRREETVTERQELYSWYEKLGASSAPLIKEKVIELHEASKKRLFKEIGAKLGHKTVVAPLWYRVAAAVVVFVAAGITFNYFQQGDELTMVSTFDIQKPTVCHGPRFLT